MSNDDQNRPRLEQAAGPEKTNEACREAMLDPKNLRIPVPGIDVKIDGEDCRIPISEPERLARLRNMVGSEKEPTTASGIYAKHRAEVAHLAQRKQDSRLWTPADLCRMVAGELQEDNRYQGRKVTKAAIVLYSEEEGERQAIVVQAGCSLLELSGILGVGREVVDKAQAG